MNHAPTFSVKILHKRISNLRISSKELKLWGVLTYDKY